MNYFYSQIIFLFPDPQREWERSAELVKGKEKVREELVKGKGKVWEKLGNGKGKFSKELVKGKGKVK